MNKSELNAAIIRAFCVIAMTYGASAVDDLLVGMRWPAAGIRLPRKPKRKEPAAPGGLFNGDQGETEAAHE